MTKDMCFIVKIFCFVG